YGGEAQVELGPLELGACLRRARLGRTQARDRRLVLLLADRASLEQVVVALDLLRGVLDLRLRACQGGLRRRDGGAHLPRVDQEELLALLDVGALLVQPALHDAVDAGAYLGRSIRL